ncbi:hypothetical protein IAU60_004526 [Kwoniella sp. DSM 27419]
MSRAEQDALVAFLNTFRLSKPVTAFRDLADGKALMEAMGKVDATHFKSVMSRNPSGPSSSAENWVLRMNTLKRLHRLLLSFPLPPPHAQNLSLSNLPEPPFSTIAKAPSTSEGSKGLAQICRLCLAVSVWAPGNEKVIAKIQGLRESHMAELMKSIEEVMATLPAEEQAAERLSPVKQSVELSPPSSGLRQERDKLLQDNDDLRVRIDQMADQVEELTSNLDEVKLERDEALEHLAAARNTSGNGLRSSQTATAIEMDRLRSDLSKTEDALAHNEEDLQKQVDIVTELTKRVEDLTAEAAEAAKLRDQLDEFRHAADRLKKSENVIEKYKKKLEESAGLRREMRAMEAENAALVETNTALEADLLRSGSSKGILDDYKFQLYNLERKYDDQTREMAELSEQLETARGALGDLEREYERDQEELQHHRERSREMELVAPGLQRTGSQASVAGGTGTLGDELSSHDDGDGGRHATKADLRMRIRALQREMAEIRSIVVEGAEGAARLDASETTQGPGASTEELASLRDEVARLQERDHQHVEDIKQLLLEKVDLQSGSSSERGLGLAQAKEVGDLRAELAAKGVSAEVQQRLFVEFSRAQELQLRVKEMDRKLHKARAQSGDFTEASKSYQAQIAALKEQVLEARQSQATMDDRYKLEQQLMLSAWHELGMRTVRDHLGAASRRVIRPVQHSWLGRQRRMVEEASFAR